MLPEVGSTIVPPGSSFPSRSAASIIVIAIRSLIEPPGFRNSSFASTVAASSGTTFWSRTSGVLPTSSSSVGYSRAIGVKRNRWLSGGCLRRFALGHRRARPPQEDERGQSARQRKRE